jgi:hypothetical protein
VVVGRYQLDVVGGRVSTFSRNRHPHSQSLLNSVTPTRSHSGLRGQKQTGTGSGNRGGGSRLRWSAEHWGGGVG